MPGVLGCANVYGARINARGGGKALARITRPARVHWERTLDGTAQATVVVPWRSDACDRRLAEVDAWAHELVLERDGDVVFEGPVMFVEDDPTGGVVTLKAADLSAWFSRRWIRIGYDFGRKPTDLTNIAEMAVRRGMSVSSVGVISYIDRRDCGVKGSRAVAADSATVAAELGDMAKSGLNWTFVGRRLVLFGEQEPLATLAPLEQRHFTAGIKIQLVGAGTTTAARIFGEGIAAEYVGAAELVDFYGRVETLAKADGELTERGAYLSARRTVQAAQRTPVAIDMAASAFMPTAPVLITELVPGVSVPLQVQGNMLRVAQDLRLEKLAVDWSEGGTEVVKPSFAQSSANLI